MAGPQQLPSGEEIRRVLETAPQLRSFILPDVTPTGRKLGGGSYGTVEELEMDGLVCAGKKLYDALIDPENHDAQRMVDKYYKACSLLSALRHPNIVQFLGICFLPDSCLPVLVTERLQCSLDEFLESTADIPLSIKVSILQDVAKGLAHLHNRRPSVIHRDLSAGNVLLDAAMTAKIADLGNSQIADIPPGQLAQTMTQGIPGTLVYMPPEVSDEEHKYGPSLDMFSFGHLSLFVAIQLFPWNLLKPTYQDPTTKKVGGRTELERRVEYINRFHVMFNKAHPLVDLIKSCLKLEPAKRPTAKQALERLGTMRTALHDPYSGLNRVQLEKSLAKKEAEIQQIPQLMSRLEEVTSDKTKLEEAKKTKDKQIVEMEAQIVQIPQFRSQLEQLSSQLEQEKVEMSGLKSGLEEICQGRDELLAVKEREMALKYSKIVAIEEEKVSMNEVIAAKCRIIENKMSQKMQKDQDLLLLQTQLDKKKRKNQYLEEQKSSMNEVIATKDRFLETKDLELAEKDRDLISLQQRYSSLQTQLETVQRKSRFLEAGQTTSCNLLDVKDALIAALQTELRGMDKLLQVKAKVPPLPSGVTFNLPLKWKKPIKMPSGVDDAQAVVVGGKVYIGGGGAEGNHYTILEYTIEGGRWREIETPVALFGIAVVNNQLFIIGGEDKEGRATNQVWALDSVTGAWTQPCPPMPTARRSLLAVGYERWVLVVGGLGERCVEVLDTTTNKWYVATPLPDYAVQSSLTVIQDVLYVVLDHSAVSLPIPIIVSSAVSQYPSSDSSSSPKSTEWQPLPNTPKCNATITSLLGLLVAMGGDLDSSIVMYFPHLEQWLEVAQLPTSRQYHACAILSGTQQLMVIGGLNKSDHYVRSIDICTL